MRLHQVGKKLRNCATMYSSRVGEGKYVLVALEHAKNATPVALGGYVVGSGQWEQAQSVPSAPTLCGAPSHEHPFSAKHSI